MFQFLVANTLGHKIVDITSTSNVMIPLRYNDFYFKTHAGAISLGRHEVSAGCLIGQQKPRRSLLVTTNQEARMNGFVLLRQTQVVQSKQGRRKKAGSLTRATTYSGLIN